MPGGSGGVSVADGSLWVARRHADDGLGISPASTPTPARCSTSFTDCPAPTRFADGDDGAIWTAGTFGAVNRIDPQTNAVTSLERRRTQLLR